VAGLGLEIRRLIIPNPESRMPSAYTTRRQYGQEIPRSAGVAGVLRWNGEGAGRCGGAPCRVSGDGHRERQDGAVHGNGLERGHWPELHAHGGLAEVEGQDGYASARLRCALVPPQTAARAGTFHSTPARP